MNKLNLRPGRVVVLGLIGLLIAGCSSVPVTTLEKGSMLNCKSRLLIASQGSEFKNEVITRISDSLNEDYCYLKVIEIDMLSAVSPENYEAVAVLDSVKMLDMSDEVVDFMKRPKAKGKVTVLMTAGGGEDEDYQFGEVDAVSAASTIEDADYAIEEMIERVRTILNRASM